MLAAPGAGGLTTLLAQRDHPMLATTVCDWLTDFAEVPEDASIPLAMSGRHPRAVGSYGAECIAWAKSELGITVRWWQALAITRQLEHDSDGALVWREVIETGPRRIGKSVRLRIVALWRTANAHRIGEKQLSMLVSKDLAVGKEIHRGSWRWAEAKDWKVTRLNGGQEVEAPDESRWLLRADTAVYGYDVGYGQVDESWGVDPQSITDGLEPALLERLWSQLHLTSTAHVRATSLMRRRLVAALRDADQDVLLLMWGAPPDADFADEATWRASSPHWSKDRRDLMARKYAAALAGDEEPEFDDPDPIRGWAAQYLNVWPLLFAGHNDGKLFPKWTDLGTKADPPRPDALAVAADPARLSLAATGDGGRYVGAVLRLPNDGRRAEFVAEVARIAADLDVPVGIDPKGSASTLALDLEDAGVDLRSLSLDERIQADADFFEAYEAGHLRHGDHDELNRDVLLATWRKVAQRQVFGKAPMVEAASIARYLAVREEASRPVPIAAFA